MLRRGAGGTPPLSSLQRQLVFLPIPSCLRALTVPLPDASSRQYSASGAGLRFLPRPAIDAPIMIKECYDKRQSPRAPGGGKMKESLTTPPPVTSRKSSSISANVPAGSSETAPRPRHETLAKRLTYC